jgi:hypothetical protein
MVSVKSLLIVLAAVGLFATAAQAADLPAVQRAAPVTVSDVPLGFFVHVGPAGLVMDEGASLKVAGQKLTCAIIAIKSQVTAAVELGYFVTPNVAVSFTGGIPPLAKIEADGTLKGYPTIGKASYGPMTLTAHSWWRELHPTLTERVPFARMPASVLGRDERTLQVAGATRDAAHQEPACRRCLAEGAGSRGAPAPAAAP